jgi:ribosomal subunit interface protein
MKIRIIGSNMDIGASLTAYVEEHLNKSVKKYFDRAISAEVHFKKEGALFDVLLTINEGAKGGITVKSDAEAGDVYGCFNEACHKAAKQLSRYKGRLKEYRRTGGLKSIEPDYKAMDAMKYVLPPLEYNVFAEMEEEVKQDEAETSLNVITDPTTDIEELSVEQAIMKMDLANLPALVFINNKNKRINVVYHRKDGNISWIDPNL